MNLMPLLVGWAVLAAVIVILLIYRSRLARQEEEGLHVLEGDISKVSQQMTVAQKLDAVDRWGKILTVLALLYGLALLGLFLWDAWERSSRGAL
jgi:hypothetical protein